MKKLWLLIALLGGLPIAVMAQGNARPTLNDNSLVKDADGVIYPALIWRKLLSSGDYTVKARKAPADTAFTFIISKRTEQEKEALLARLPKPNESAVFKVGNMMLPFKDKDIKGEKFDSKKLLGKVLVINFWFIGCPPCRQEIPDLNKLVDAYKNNNDVIFIAIALDEDYQIEEFIKQQPYNYHLIANGRYWADKAKLNLYPTNVVVDRDGKIAFSSVSFNIANPRWMKKAIDDALAVPGKTKQAASE